MDDKVQAAALRAEATDAERVWDAVERGGFQRCVGHGYRSF